MATKLDAKTSELMTLDAAPQGTMLPSTEIRRAPMKGLEGLGSDDLVIPRWQVVQPTSQMEGAEKHVGHWYRNIDGQFRETLECVILAILPSRVKFPQGSSKGAPECVSRDGITGSVHGACSRCQYNWKANAKMRAAKAAGEDVDECHDGYTLLLVDDLDTMSPALMGCKSKAVRPVQILYSQLRFQRKASSYHCVTTVELDFQKNDRGKFYVPRFVLGEPFDKATLAQWDAMYDLLSPAIRQEAAWNPADDVEAAEPAFNAESLNDPRAATDDF